MEPHLLVLNKDQNFMLDNKGLNLIITKEIKWESQIKKLSNEKFEEKKSSLKQYLMKRKGEWKLNEVDLTLFEYMNDELKEEFNTILVQE